MVRAAQDHRRHRLATRRPRLRAGPGRTATPEHAQRVHSALRKWLKDNVNAEVSQNLRILYGGSVTAANAKEFTAFPDMDGFLVSGPPNPDFVQIVNTNQK